MKNHLNVNKDECSHIYVTYYVNRFEAYVCMKNKNYIIFATEYTFPELKNREEFKKYVDEWKLPIWCSESCRNRRLSDITSGFSTWSARFV